MDFQWDLQFPHHLRNFSCKLWKNPSCIIITICIWDTFDDSGWWHLCNNIWWQRTRNNRKSEQFSPCENEDNNEMSFLDILIIKNEDISIKNTIYTKKTHTRRYLNFKSYHHTSQKISAIEALACRTFVNCDLQIPN